MESQPPPRKDANGKDLIVMTRINTKGLRRLAEGSLVEKSPLDSIPPEPLRVPHQRMPGAPKTLVAAEEDAFGADASEDRTIALNEAQHASALAQSSRGPAVAEPSVVTSASTAPPPAKKSLPVGGAPPGVVVDPRLELETPTTMFVKDIQATLQEELAKQKGSTPMPAPIDDIAPVPSEAVVQARRVEPAPLPAKKKSDPPLRGVESPFKSVPPPPTAKPASLAPPPAKSAASLPAPLPGQANRKKDPVAVSVTNRPGRIERKGGFAAWAAALTALGVFVGVAGARVATGGLKLPAAAAPAPATEVGFAPRVTVPADEKKVDEKKPEPATEKVEAKVEPKAEEKKPDAVEAKVEEKKPEAKPVEEKKAEAKPVEKAEEKREEKKVEAKAERAEEKPVVRRAPRPEPVEKPEPVAAKPKPERTEKAAEKAEKRPDPPKATGKSPDVAAAARDYAAVESQLGQSL